MAAEVGRLAVQVAQLANDLDVKEATVIELARRIAPQTETFEQAERELRAALEVAQRQRARGVAPGATNEFVTQVLAEVKALTDNAKLDEAAVRADAALDALEAAEAAAR